jgi:hypothetical protein
MIAFWWTLFPSKKVELMRQFKCHQTIFLCQLSFWIHAFILEIKTFKEMLITTLMDICS